MDRRDTEGTRALLVEIPSWVLQCSEGLSRICLFHLKTHLGPIPDASGELLNHFGDCYSGRTLNGELGELDFRPIFTYY